MKLFRFQNISIISIGWIDLYISRLNIYLFVFEHQLQFICFGFLHRNILFYIGDFPNLSGLYAKFALTPVGSVV